MPLTSFLIVVGGFVGLLGICIPWVFGVPGGTHDMGTRQLAWVAIVAFPLFLAPAVSIVRLQRLTRGLAVFATVCGGLVALLLLWTGTPGLLGPQVGWVVQLLSALAVVTGGTMAIKAPPDTGM